MPRQSGLVPLGPDPVSGLPEFAVEGTGMVPERAADSGQLPLSDHTAIVLVLLPGGTFRMGAPDQEHEVTLSPFFLAKTECTRAQWYYLTDHKRLPSYEVNEDPWLFPAVNITWEECNRALAEHGLTLPTEAQWEYACRRGWAADPPTPDLEDERRRLARHVGNVAEGRANHLGLYDLPGNAWEWVLDAESTPRSHVARDPIQIGTEGDLRVVRDWRVFWREIYRARHLRRPALPCTRYRRLGFRASRAVTTNATGESP